MASGQLRRLSFMVDASLFDAVDRARGDVPRERWLRRAVERALGEQPSGQADAPVPTPAEQPESVPEAYHEMVARNVPRPAREFRPYPKGGK